MKNNTNKTKKNRKGFTLIEVIAVLVLLGILTAIAVPKYIDMSEQAKIKAIEAGVAELNSREALQWGQNQLAGTNVAVDTDLGEDYIITPVSGTVTSIEFKDIEYGVNYTAPTGIGPGVYTLGTEQ